MVEYIKFKLENIVIPPRDERVFQIAANEFCIGHPDKSFSRLSLQVHETIYLKILKRFFPDKYVKYMADMFERSTGRIVIPLINN